MIRVEKRVPVARERLVTVRDDAPLVEAAKFLDGRDINLVVVCDKGGAMVGIVTRTNVVRQMALCQGCGCTAAAGSVMTKDVTSGVSLNGAHFPCVSETQLNRPASLQLWKLSSGSAMSSSPARASRRFYRASRCYAIPPQCEVGPRKGNSAPCFPPVSSLLFCFRQNYLSG